MPDQRLPCRSVSPLGDPCDRPRGHRGDVHRMSEHDRRRRQGRSSAAWTGGIRTPAVWFTSDAGLMTEADWQTWWRTRR